MPTSKQAPKLQELRRSDTITPALSAPAPHDGRIGVNFGGPDPVVILPGESLVIKAEGKQVVLYRRPKR